MNSPLISILVPVYNVEKYVCECIDSIIAQTYKNLEIILVDDGSTDQSGAICDEYAQKDSRIKVIHQENKGLAAVRNVAVATATGEYVGFVDSDDFVALDMYEKMLNLSQNKNADIVMCNIAYTDEKGTLIPNNKSAKNITSNEMSGKEFLTNLCQNYNSIYVITVNKLYKRSLFDDIHYPDGKTHEDEAVIHRISHKCTRIVFTSDTFYFYRQQSQSIMNRPFSTRHLDNMYSLLDRVDFLKKQDYSSDIIYSAEMYLWGEWSAICKSIDIKNKEHVTAVRGMKSLLKPIFKELLKSNIPTKKEKFAIIVLKISPLLYIKIFKRNK